VPSTRGAVSEVTKSWSETPVSLSIPVIWRKTGAALAAPAVPPEGEVVREALPPLPVAAVVAPEEAVADVEEVEVVEPPELPEDVEVAELPPEPLVGRKRAAAAVVEFGSLVDGEEDEAEEVVGVVAVVVVVVVVLLVPVGEVVPEEGDVVVVEVVCSPDTTDRLFVEEPEGDVRPLSGAAKGDSPRTGPDRPLPNSVPGGRRSSRTSSTGRYAWRGRAPPRRGP